MSKKITNNTKLLGLIPIIPLLLSFIAIAPSAYNIQPHKIISSQAIVPSNVIPIAPLENKYDYPPSLDFFSDTQHAQTTAVLTAVAVDFGDNAGIQWIRIYEDNNLLSTKNCNGNTPCTFVYTKVETQHISHSYYAEAKDLGNNVVKSETIVIEFEGLNHPPQITDYEPDDLTPEVNVSDTLHFEVWATDPDGDVLSYKCTLDSEQVSTDSSWDYQPSIDDVGSHEVVVVVSDGEYEVNQTWQVKVLKVESFCSLSFNPPSPISYTDQPFVASCSCTNPEAKAELWRDGQNVTTENNQPVTLAAKPSGYIYVCNVSETAHYQGASSSSIYVINKAPSEVNLLLNGVDGNITVGINETVEINGTLIVPSSSPGPRPIPDEVALINPKQIKSSTDNLKTQQQLKMQQQVQPQPKPKQYTIELWLDQVLVATGEHNLSYSTSFNESGLHNVTLLYPETQNYSSSSETHWIEVIADEESPVVSLISPADNAVLDLPNVTVSYNVTDNFDSLLDCEIWSNTSGSWQLDGTQQTTNGSSNFWNYTGLANGIYSWNVRCIDNAGNDAWAPSNWQFIVNVTEEDITPPTISNLVIEPRVAPQFYVIEINATVTDNVAVDTVLAIITKPDHSEKIVPMTDLSDDVYGCHFGDTDLIGPYNLTIWANDTSGNINELNDGFEIIQGGLHDIAIESLTLLKEVNGVNKSIEETTAYLNDQIYVLALIKNAGTFNESNINITLQNNMGIIDSKLIDLDAGQIALVSMVWNAAPDGWHTLRVKALPVEGETNFTNNEYSQDVRVWKVCDVIDCSLFGPQTASENYTLGQPFRVKALMQNAWNNETFKDLKVELVVDSGLQIIAPWPAVQYFDLNVSQFKVVNWNVNSTSQGNYSITAWLGNREYDATKYVEII